MIWTVAGVGCDEIVRANPRGRSYSRWHGFGATESPAINSSTVFISLIRLSDSLCRYYLRQDQVASLVGVNKNTMCSYENDVRQPSYEILVRLATIYRVSTDYLLGCESKRTVDVSGLTPKEIQTITELVADMTEKNKKLEGL